MYSAAATTNYATSTVLKVGADGNVTPGYWRPILQWDLTAIPTSASILSASLYVYVAADNATTGRTVQVVRCLRSWSRTQVTWNEYTTGNNWETGGAQGAGDIDAINCGQCDFTSSQVNGDEKIFTLTTSIVQGWVTTPATNNGLVMFTTDTTADSWDLHSEESATSSYYPKLVIGYYLPSGGGWW
jgi:hypothetical protein